MNAITLSEHFSLAELTQSSTAVRLGIDNTPSVEIIQNLRIVAKGLERVRALLEHPLHIDSGYRCLKLNTAVNGAKNSQHMDGWCADFICAAFGTPLEIVKIIVKSGILFDECIQEGHWVHISFAPALRQRVLTAHFDDKGVATYTEGS